MSIPWTFQKHVAFVNAVVAGVSMLVAFLSALIDQKMRRMMRASRYIITNLVNFACTSEKSVTTFHGRSVGIAGESAGQFL